MSQAVATPSATTKPHPSVPRFHLLFHPRRNLLPSSPRITPVRHRSPAALPLRPPIPPRYLNPSSAAKCSPSSKAASGASPPSGVENPARASCASIASSTSMSMKSYEASLHCIPPRKERIPIVLSTIGWIRIIRALSQRYGIRIFGADAACTGQGLISIRNEMRF
ncbi:hypothetical protein K458DRAFT_89745 [Lentithecium fluviatile CBS 122367]|uniref:Uncharacterized protein n=1 Tax=Lentithecium fluviatile CBS 122367 TaxID=1168545 RepID=A0A6G1IRT6_9PLEO|nr:hypothetical protein K458DRAFT_89745 [Lentithecium fluviatile CBS 122367]